VGDVFATGSPAWVAFYLAGTVGVTAWVRRADLRRGGRARAIALLDLLCNVGMTIPALAYWDAALATRLADWLLWVLFALGLAGMAGFTIHDANTMLANPRLSLRQRRVFAAIGAAAVLLPSVPEVWWGASALAHVYAGAAG
jgi:hypothetical protein